MHFVILAMMEPPSFHAMDLTSAAGLRKGADGVGANTG